MNDLPKPIMFRNVPHNVPQEAYEKWLADRIKTFWEKQGKTVSTWVESNTSEGPTKVKVKGGGYIEAYRKFTTLGVRSNLVNGLPGRSQ